LSGAGDHGLEILASVQKGPRRPSRVFDACHGRSATSVLLALTGTREGWPRRALRDYLACWRTVRADIRGSDLLRAGIRPGPAVAIGLDEARRAKLDGRAASRREQLEIALRAAHGA
jgi:tRNA nucleotidyltransferase (CCA-adding enzyme)